MYLDPIYNYSMLLFWASLNYLSPNLLALKKKNPSAFILCCPFVHVWGHPLGMGSIPVVTLQYPLCVGKD